MFKNLYYKLFVGIHLYKSLNKIRYFEKKLYSKSARFAIPFCYRGKGYFKKIEPRQNSFEIEELYKIICQMEPRAVLEIGTARGGTLYLWAQASRADALILSVDLPGGKFGGAYPAERIPFYKAFARNDQKIHLLRKNSHAAETLETVKRYLVHQPVDFAFIDGDHTYEGVKSDFYLYSPLVRKGGIIAFHDILARPDVRDIEVHRFWNEIKNSYASEEIIGPDGSGKKVGIGLLHVDEPITRDERQRVVGYDFLHGCPEVNPSSRSFRFKSAMYFSRCLLWETRCCCSCVKNVFQRRSNTRSPVVPTKS